ncbi:hypothetical protein [Acetilactobacillus jinshanensis]|uniref:Uncharacterized protein n=1 Tax=Acetilactobacillus jinshanensis TaxID=1720083 RepID=A0A4V1ALN9_9LACO|nr:hypothetical protein [Acetilactobacillus jinshanensis]QBP18259.1 hypothetical protein ELX58_03715 [Acetilactobacillus jinshanensis]URL61971.1 hypothetical protein HGK75_08010 [uncultured bacterium]
MDETLARNEALDSMANLSKFRAMERSSMMNKPKLSSMFMDASKLMDDMVSLLTGPTILESLDASR